MVKIDNSPVKITRLKDIHETFKKWLHLKDFKRLDSCLAVRLAMTKKTKTPLWLILIAPSGDGKSEILEAFNHKDEAVVLSKITARTLVSGTKREEDDLAPKLNDKLLIIKDMASLLKLHPNEKALVWAQLRELYDGECRTASGMGTQKEYTDLWINFLGGSTPAIDSQILIHQSLGTRELCYRSKSVNKLHDKLMDKCWDNEDYGEQMKKELKEVVRSYFLGRRMVTVDIPKNVKDDIKQMANYLRYMRAVGHTDAYSGELVNDVSVEQPTRVLKQLKRFFIALKNLDPDYSDEKAMNIIWHIVKSSISQKRHYILDFLVEQKTNESSSRIAEVLKIGKKPAFRELNCLWNMGIVNRKEIVNDYGNVIRIDWRINEKHEVIKFMNSSLSKYRTDMTTLVYNPSPNNNKR